MTPESVLVMQNTGPVGHPGMPEAGMVPIPKKLATQGIQDLVRISDARMSGTAQGTVVLHVAPEAAVGGPIALVKNGDIIRIDAEKGEIWLEVGEEELNNRKREWQEGQKSVNGTKKRGYGGLYSRSVLQADLGADFDWLRADYEK